MPCCNGHTCDYCATCKLGVCCGDKGGGGHDPEAQPIRKRTRTPERTAVPRTRPAMPV